MKQNEQEKLPIAFYALILIQTLVGMSFYMVAPLVTKYLVENTGTTIMVAGMLSGLMSYVSLFMRPVSGVLADRVPQRNLLVVSILAFGLAIAGYGVSASHIVFAIMRVASGAAFCVATTTIYAFAGKYIPDSRMGAGIGYLGLGNIIASAIGPLISTSLTERMGYSVSFAIAGTFSLICVVVLLVMPAFRETKSLSRPEKATEKSWKLSQIFVWKLVPIAVMGGLFSYASGTISNFMLLFAEERAIAGASVYFTVLSISLFVVRPIVGRVNDRKGLNFVLIPCMLITLVGLMLIVNASALWMLVLAAVFMAFGQGGGQPAVQAECLRKMSPAQRGVATGTFLMFGDIAQGLAPTIGGGVSDSMGYPAAFVICIGFFVVGIAAYGISTLISRKRVAI